MPGFISEMMQSKRKDKLFDDLVEKHYNKIFKYCHYRLYQDDFLAEECTQDVFVTLFKSMDALSDFDKIDRWLYKTADNFVRRMLVKSAREMKRTCHLDSVENLEDSVSFSYEDRYERLEQDGTDVGKCVTRIFENLTDMDIKIWELYYQQRKTQQEVADHLALSLGAVKSRTSRLRQKITVLARRILEDAG